MEKKIFDFGEDMTMVIKGPSNVDISDMNFFDELEYECWELIKKYADAFGFEIEEINSDNEIDFYAAKQIQDRIIDLFKDAGITFSTNEHEKIANRYPHLIGFTDDERKELHGIDEVADFICEHGKMADVTIIKPDGEEFLSTFGLYLNKICDMEYRAELLKVLVPKQHEVENTIFDEEQDEGMGGMSGM